MSYFEEADDREDHRETEVRQGGKKITDKEILRRAKKLQSDYGLCMRCKALLVIRTRLQTEIVGCKDYEITGEKAFVPLKAHDPIEECSEFEPAGSMSLNQMLSMATFIDAKKDKPCGF